MCGDQCCTACAGACPNSICGMQAVMFAQADWEKSAKLSQHIPPEDFSRMNHDSWGSWRAVLQVKAGIEFWWTKPQATWRCLVVAFVKVKVMCAVFAFCPHKQLQRKWAYAVVAEADVPRKLDRHTLDLHKEVTGSDVFVFFASWSTVADTSDELPHKS